MLGSHDWMMEHDPLVSPGPEAAQAGMDLATTQVGPIAVNLNNYYYNAARVEQNKAHVAHIVLHDLQKAQPCQIEEGADGVYRCKAGTGVASSGFLPDSLFGIQMPWSSSMPDDGKDHKVTSGQASAMKAKLKKLMTTDPSLTETERDAVTEIGQEVH